MKKTLVVEASEREIVELINKHFPSLNYDSIVAAEELGNQVWVTSVYKPDTYDLSSLGEIIKTGDYMYKTRNLLNCLVGAGELEEGKYNIDCTW